MARDAVTIKDLVADAAGTPPSATDIDPADGAIINAGGDFHGLLVEITHTAASAKDITIKAGVGARSSLGDLEVEFAAGNVNPQTRVFALESARFAQADGSIHIDFETGATGTVRAYRLPRGA